MDICGFSKAWIGKCNNKKGKCIEHDGLKCSSCGESATRSCPETGQFVCGVPLCDNCEHTIYEDGTNGGIGFDGKQRPEGMKQHCKKGEQRHTPWHEREER